MKIVISFLVVVSCLVLAGTAMACNFEKVSGYGCTDNGTTVFFQDINAALEQYPDLTPGKCVVPETPPVVVVEDGGPAHTYLCGSYLYAGTVPSVELLSDAPALIAKGYKIPVAISQAEAVKRGIPTYKWNPVGSDVLACNRDGLKGTGTGYNGAGGDSDFQGAAQWKALITGSPNWWNHYEKYVGV